MTFRGLLYFWARILGDINALSRGPDAFARRIVRRIVGRWIGRNIMRKL